MHQKNSLKIKQNLCATAVILALLSCSTQTRQGPWSGSEAVTCDGDNCVAAGAYNIFLLGGGIPPALPLGAFSTNGGQTFASSTQFSVESVQTTPPTSIELLGINCSGQHCVGVGTYNLKFIPSPTAVSSLPLIATSNDGGQTFSTNASQPTLPSDAEPVTSSELLGITCNGKVCVTVGVYNLAIAGAPVSTLPFVAQSTDGGATFPTTSRPALPDGASTITNNAFLYGVSCPDATRCVAIGTYNWDAIATLPSLPTSRPYATISDDGGATFAQASVPTLPGDALPTVDQRSELRAISCKDKHCVAVGFYNRNDSATPTATASPLVVISEDGGATFPKAYKPSLPLGANASLYAQLTGISCLNTRCVAVGDYNVEFGIGTNPTASIPFVLVSNDSGETFSTAYAPTLPNSPGLALLTGVSCSKKHCVAVGGYNLIFTSTNVNSGSPLILVSDNSGDSFTPTPSFTLPAGADPTLGAAMFGLPSQFN